ncbi:ABC transporter substrate-binding protein [Klebsiella pneumoniae]|nr:ABC transporter substrate-binding protein [Klebsiella pneumoniae]
MNTRLTPVFTLLTVAALATSASCFAAEKFTFLTNWYAQAEHGGFYQAQATGLYQHAGLDVEIKMGGPQINVMQLMAAGQADCTLGDNGQALETWQAGVHAVTVATVFQHSPTVFITHDKVENPAELKDKTFLLATEAYTSFWPWAKSELGLAGSKVRPYTFNVQPFLADKNLVQQGYVTSEPFLRRQRRAAVLCLSAQRLGLPALRQLDYLYGRHHPQTSGGGGGLRQSLHGRLEKLPAGSRPRQQPDRQSESADGRRADRLWHCPDEAVPAGDRRRC